MALGGSVMEGAGDGEEDGEAEGAGADRKASWRAIGGAEGAGAKVDADGVGWIVAGREETPAFGMTIGREDGDTDGALDSLRGMGVLRDSVGCEGVTLGVGVVGLVGVVGGFPKLFGATAFGVPPPLPGRVVGGSVCVNRSVGLLVGRGAGRPGDEAGATLADGMLAAGSGSASQRPMEPSLVENSAVRCRCDLAGRRSLGWEPIAKLPVA